ncbi:MAG: TetR/AcrR family transcriptional regulator [Myxococcota bacterium]
MTPRPSNTEARRRQIAQALMHVMATEGYDGATITAIAAEAGLTPGVVHYHFGSKLEIMLHMLHLLREDHRATLTEALKAAGDAPWDRLKTFLDVHLAVGAHTDPHVTASWVALGSEALRHPPVARAYAETLEENAALLRSVIAQGCERGVFATDNVDIDTAALMATIQGYFAVAATTRRLIPRGSAAGAALRMAHGLLRPSRSED